MKKRNLIALTMLLINSCTGMLWANINFTNASTQNITVEILYKKDNNDDMRDIISTVTAGTTMQPISVPNGAIRKGINAYLTTNDTKIDKSEYQLSKDNLKWLTERFDECINGKSYIELNIETSNNQSSVTMSGYCSTSTPQLLHTYSNPS